MGCLVRNRIIQIAMDEMERSPPMSWAEKRQLKQQRAPRAVKWRLEETAKTTEHDLEPIKGGWRCTRCRQTILKRKVSTARWGLQQRCPAAARQERCKSVTLRGRSTHFSHAMRWSRTQSKWFCEHCGGIDKEIIQKKLAEQCQGSQPLSKQGRYLPKVLRQKP